LDLNTLLRIIPFDHNNVNLFDGTIHQIDNLIHKNELDFILDNETLTIPNRSYFDELNPALKKTLTAKQKNILNCIYLRDHNGYLREKGLNLLSDNLEK
jgi:hypothetical protein